MVVDLHAHQSPPQDDGDTETPDRHLDGGSHTRHSWRRAGRAGDTTTAAVASHLARSGSALPTRSTPGAAALPAGPATTPHIARATAGARRALLQSPASVSTPPAGAATAGATAARSMAPPSPPLPASPVTPRMPAAAAVFPGAVEVGGTDALAVLKVNSITRPTLARLRAVIGGMVKPCTVFVHHCALPATATAWTPLSLKLLSPGLDVLQIAPRRVHHPQSPAFAAPGVAPGATPVDDIRVSDVAAIHCTALDDTPMRWQVSLTVVGRATYVGVCFCCLSLLRVASVNWVPFVTPLSPAPLSLSSSPHPSTHCGFVVDVLHVPKLCDSVGGFSQSDRHSVRR